MVFYDYSNLQRPKRFNSIRQIFRGRAHIERAKGSDIENQEYCSKGGDVWQCGTPCAQGTRTDLQKVVSVIEGGERDIKNLAIQFPCAYIKYWKGIEQYIRVAHGNPERDFKTEVFYFWGPTGTESLVKRARRAALSVTPTTSHEGNGGMDTPDNPALLSMTSMDGSNTMSFSRSATDILTESLSKEDMKTSYLNIYGSQAKDH